MSDEDRAEADWIEGQRISVRVDGEWCPEMYHYTPELPVFCINNQEIDVREDGTILYESPGGAVEELEPYVNEGGVASYSPLRIYPATMIEVHIVGVSEAIKHDE